MKKRYNEISIARKKSLDSTLKYIFKESGVNILEDSRKRPIPSYRSLFNKICLNKYKLTPTNVAHYYLDKGLKIDSSTIYYSVEKFKQYSEYDNNLLDLYFYLHPSAMSKKKHNFKTTYVYNKKLTPIQKLVTDLTDAQEKELIELITLRKKSWEWKSKDTLKLYTGS